MNDVIRSQYRLPQDVDLWLKEEAERDGRSKNSMLVAALRQCMNAQKRNAPTAATVEA
ncbi:Arc family DNA-binding protein [Herbaspirillum huttiense]|uniref:Arc family DNA-binding protein n=1 Tax=Herbaspirillum huttiense TaxID=863372 RepID=UPI003F3FC4B2